MIEYISGKIDQLNPAYVIIDVQGLGYMLNISMYSYSQIEPLKEVRVLVHEVIREDVHDLYGFYTEKERSLFRMLITVSGIGANTARLMLSKLSPDELQTAIMHGDVAVLKNVKGIGAKSAQRVIVDLKDKVGNVGEIGDVLIAQDNTVRDEALSALVMLGFQKAAVEKMLAKILKENPSVTVEDAVKAALKGL